MDQSHLKTSKQHQLSSYEHSYQRRLVTLASTNREAPGSASTVSRQPVLSGQYTFTNRNSIRRVSTPPNTNSSTSNANSQGCSHTQMAVDLASRVLPASLSSNLTRPTTVAERPINSVARWVPSGRGSELRLTNGGIEDLSASGGYAKRGKFKLIRKPDNPVAGRSALRPVEAQSRQRCTTAAQPTPASSPVPAPVEQSVFTTRTERNMWQPLQHAVPSTKQSSALGRAAVSGATQRTAISPVEAQPRMRVTSAGPPVSASPPGRALVEERTLSTFVKNKTIQPLRRALSSPRGSCTLGASSRIAGVVTRQPSAYTRSRSGLTLVRQKASFGKVERLVRGTLHPSGTKGIRHTKSVKLYGSPGVSKVSHRKLIRIGSSLYKVSTSGKSRTLKRQMTPAKATKAAPTSALKRPTAMSTAPAQTARSLFATKRLAQSLLQARRKKAARTVVPRKLCMHYLRTGKCEKQAAGTCRLIHDADKVAVCMKWLHGGCNTASCALQHKVCRELMPVCSFFLQGLCSNENCPYLHVNLDPAAPVCKEFLNGYCPNGCHCPRKHFSARQLKEYRGSKSLVVSKKQSGKMKRTSVVSASNARHKSAATNTSMEA